MLAKQINNPHFSNWKYRGIAIFLYLFTIFLKFIQLWIFVILLSFAELVYRSSLLKEQKMRNVYKYSDTNTIMKSVE